MNQTTALQGHQGHSKVNNTPPSLSFLSQGPSRSMARTITLASTPTPSDTTTSTVQTVSTTASGVNGAPAIAPTSVTASTTSPSQCATSAGESAAAPPRPAPDGASPAHLTTVRQQSPTAAATTPQQTVTSSATASSVLTPEQRAPGVERDAATTATDSVVADVAPRAASPRPPPGDQAVATTDGQHEASCGRTGVSPACDRNNSGRVNESRVFVESKVKCEDQNYSKDIAIKYSTESTSSGAKPIEAETEEEDKPHVCGSFFAPCCAHKAGSRGVITFASRASTAGKASPSSWSGSGSSHDASASAPAHPAGEGRARSPPHSAAATPIIGTEVAGTASGGSTSSGISLARILERPVYSEASQQHVQHVQKKKSSGIVCFHPEFQPRLVTAGAPATHRFPMPARAMGNHGSSTSGGTAGPAPTGAPSEGRPGGGTVRTLPAPQPPDYQYMKKLIPELKLDIKQKETKIAQLETELASARRSLQKKDAEMTRLHREIHKMQSVLAASPALSNGELAAHLQTSAAGPAANLVKAHIKKQGVSGECTATATDSDHMGEADSAPKFDKDFRSKQLIKEAIMENDFLKKLDSSQLREIVDSMYPKSYAKGTYIIREGEIGSHLFVSAEGHMEVIQDGRVLGQMGPGKAFGELAILYNCTRTASVKAVTAVRVWELERRVFRSVMVRTGLRRLEHTLAFLRSVPLLESLSRDQLGAIADVAHTEHYAPGSYIIREGTSGDTFYIINAGSVKVTQNSEAGGEQQIRTLQTGGYFGEQALLREDKRTASIIALSPGVSVLAIDRTSFQKLIGNLQELRELKYEPLPARRGGSAQREPDNDEFAHVSLDSLDIVATLGVGGFGRVELVQNIHNRGQTLALKCLKKHYIVETQQQEHVHSEKEIMLMCNHQFIVRLYKTFRDAKFVYLLMDACLGGEVWSILRDKGQFNTETCRFYTACVVEALEYLHGRNIVYRDLKPENLLLDCDGFCKLTDFGFSKELRNHGKTWTFCGTPEYVSPEVILNKGHDRAVDYWSLGVLMFELYTGAPPFSASEPMKTYNIILRGIDAIEFPRHVSRTAENLIKKLCRDSPTERLGYQKNGVDDIRRHKWFEDFDWEALRNRNLTPPILPQVRGPTDVSNFDSYGRDPDIPPDELSGWDEGF